MNFKIKATLILLCTIPSISSAATGSWQREHRGNTHYVTDSMRTSFFNAPSSTPWYVGKITRVSWSFSDYENGYDVQKVDICYQKEGQLDPSPSMCIDISDIHNGYIDEFYDNLDPRGTILLRYKLTGGYYPAMWYSSAPKNTVRVDYTY